MYLKKQFKKLSAFWTVVDGLASQALNLKYKKKFILSRENL